MIHPSTAACAALAVCLTAGPALAQKNTTAGAVRTSGTGTAAKTDATTDTGIDTRARTSGPGEVAEYRLGPGDKLRIEVYKDAQLSQSLQIRPDGKITLPLVGDLEATGQTPIELRDVITARLKEYVTNPTVTVIVVEALASHVYVMGEIAHAGPIQLLGPTTILQVLAKAGGFKDFANTKDIKVLRPTAHGTTTLRFNYKDAINGSAKPFYVIAGDTVIVP